MDEAWNTYHRDTLIPPPTIVSDVKHGFEAGWQAASEWLGPYLMHDVECELGNAIIEDRGIGDAQCDCGLEQAGNDCQF